jgi:hypothetical protein
MTFQALRAPERRQPCTRETRQCQFTTWGQDAVRPDCCTAHLLELTTFVHELLDRHGIVHWLDFGTLLGAVRSGEFIPWDPDVDVGILERDADAVRALQPEIEGAGYVLKLDEPSVLRVAYSALNNAHVDLMLWREENGSLVFDEDPAWQWPGMIGRTTFPEELVQHLTTVQLYGRAFPAPGKVHELLRDYRYGPDYLTPTREIVNSDVRRLIAYSESTPLTTHLLQLIADRNSRLLELTTRHSRLARTAPWRVGSGKWALVCGLPLGPEARHLEDAWGQVPDGERGPAVEKLVWSLAWIERSIGEYERPPSLIRLRRAYRRPLWLRRGLAEKLGRADRSSNARGGSPAASVTR